MQTITVTATSNHNGTAQRIAKGGGRQRTTNVDHALSSARMMGEAAGNLGVVLGWQPEDNITRGEKWGTFINHSR